MRKLFALTSALLLTLPAHAHRLDEYLQATILSFHDAHIELSMRLVPGVAVAPAIIVAIDTNHDGTLSPAEQTAYAQRVHDDLTLQLDNHLLPLHLSSASFPSIDQIKQGLGEIQLTFIADAPTSNGQYSLLFQNHHQASSSVFLVNTLVPEDPNLHLGDQLRNQNQSTYQLAFTQGPVPPAATTTTFSGFAGAFRLGVQHIAEGTDHLLFLLTLLLPAPLLALAGRWARTATIQRSLLQILRIVTAFTIGHSVTLLLSAFDVLHLPSRPVEVLIAVSILVSAMHALRPIFPGREAVIAAFFGLIHGAAFASALTDLGFTQTYRLVSILGFNLGIEAMQLAVVAAILPSLLLLSRMPTYTPLRIAGALFAVSASAAWITERTLNTPNPIAPLIDTLARHAPWLALILFALSLLCWLLRTRASTHDTALQT